MSRRQRKRLYHALVLVGVGCFFTLVAVLVQPFYSINLWLSDQLFTSEPPPNIVIAGIDDDTLEEYGRWSEWPRSLHAQAINNLNEAKAKVIGFDIVFTDSSPDDQVLAAAMASANNVVLVNVGTQPLHQAESEIAYDHFLFPVATLEQASNNMGHANVVPVPRWRSTAATTDSQGYKRTNLPSLCFGGASHVIFYVPPSGILVEEWYTPYVSP